MFYSDNQEKMYVYNFTSVNTTHWLPGGFGGRYNYSVAFIKLVIMGTKKP